MPWRFKNQRNRRHRWSLGLPLPPHPRRLPLPPRRRQLWRRRRTTWRVACGSVTLVRRVSVWGVLVFGCGCGCCCCCCCWCCCRFFFWGGFFFVAVVVDFSWHVDMKPKQISTSIFFNLQVGWANLSRLPSMRFCWSYLFYFLRHEAEHHEKVNMNFGKHILERTFFPGNRQLPRK